MDYSNNSGIVFNSSKLPYCFGFLLQISVEWAIRVFCHSVWLRAKYMLLVTCVGSQFPWTECVLFAGRHDLRGLMFPASRSARSHVTQKCAMGSRGFTLPSQNDCKELYLPHWGALCALHSHLRSSKRTLWGQRNTQLVSLVVWPLGCSHTGN